MVTTTPTFPQQPASARCKPAAARAKGARRPKTKSNAWLAGLVALTIALAGALPVSPGHAQATKPYDSQLLRLSEILGAIHYLRELCGAGDGQIWRKQMRELLRAEGSSALRRARLSRSFNEGYRSYSRTYKICTASAKTAVERFLTEGTEIADKLIKQNP